MGKISDLEWSRQCFCNPNKRKDSAALFAYSHLSYRDQKKLINSIPPPFQKYLFIDNPLPVSYDSFFSKVNFVPHDEMIGLGCMVQQLMPYRKELNQFVILKNEYENDFLLGNYDRCASTLDQIDQICLSLWSLENRLLLKKVHEGTETALGYKDEIGDVASPLAKLMTTLLWSKVDANYSLSPIEQKLYLTLHSIGFSDQSSSFYIYKTLKYNGGHRYGDSMVFALMSSVIDIYEFVLDMIVHKAKEFSKEDLTQVRTMLSDLGKKIYDRRIEKLNEYSLFSKTIYEDKEHDDLLDNYNKGDFHQVATTAPNYLMQHACDIDAMDVFVKAWLFLNDKDNIPTYFFAKDSYAEQILQNLYFYLKKESTAQMAFARLSVISNQLSSLKVGNCLYEKLSSYEDVDYTLDKYVMYDTYSRFSGMDIISGDYDNAAIEGEIPLFLKQRAAVLAFNEMEKKRRDAILIKFYNNAFFCNPLIVSQINAKRLLERHDIILNFLDLDALETCVFYAITSAPRHMVYHFFKKYIKAQQSQIPSELLQDGEKVLSPLLECFFERVCTVDILKLYIKLFPTADIVLEERLKILTSLSKKSGEKRYLREITRIKRRQKTNKRVQELDQRMIFVDENAIKETELTDVEKQFYVYIQTENILETKQYMIEAEGFSVDDINKGPMKVKTEKVQYKRLLFRQMFLDIRRQFLTSYNNGLDFYLSTRIRHGTLLNQLRSAFEENDLITNKKNGVYKDNTVMVDRVLGLSGEQRGKVIEKLRDFSKEIDDYILHIKNDVIQVQAMDLPEQFPQAIFNYDRMIDERDITSLYIEKTSDIDDYVEFVEVIFAFLWEKTEALLEAMREYLDNVKSDLEAKIENLEHDVIAIIGENKRLDGFVDKAKKSIEGMAENVEKVKKWFYRGKCDDDDFQLRDVVDACKESVSIHRNFDFQLSIVDNSVTWIKGEYFRKVSDLFMIFFNNIIDYKNNVMIDLDNSVKIEENKNLIKITISNNLVESDIPKMEKYIEETRGKLGDPHYLQFASKEKGSGHFKAYNMIHNMLPSDNEAFTMSISEKRFEVRFKIDTTYIKTNENTNS